MFMNLKRDLNWNSRYKHLRGGLDPEPAAQIFFCSLGSLSVKEFYLEGVDTWQGSEISTIPRPSLQTGFLALNSQSILF